MRTAVTPRTGGRSGSSPTDRFPALDVLVLIGLLAATALGWSWPWGVLFIYWSVPALRHGETLLLRPLSRTERPVIFWIVTLLWVVFGVVTILADAAPSVLGNLYVGAGES